MMFKPLLEKNYYFLRKQVWSIQHHTFERHSSPFPHSIKDVQSEQTTGEAL